MNIIDNIKEKIFDHIPETILFLLASLLSIFAVLLDQIFGIQHIISKLSPVPLAKLSLLLLGVILFLITYIIYLKTKDKLIYFNELLWLPKDPIPFCPRCKEVDGKLIHMVFNPQHRGSNAHYLCSNPKCELWRAPSEHPKKKINKK